MTPLKSTELAELLGGEHRGAERVVDSVVIHSDDAGEGCVFVALSGGERDGHEFVPQAQNASAVALVECEVDAAQGTSVRVPNCVVALRELAVWQRNQCSAAQVVAITGSAGKTTTRHCTASILSQSGPTASSKRSYNNYLGVPLSVLRSNTETRWLVLELGANAPGEIADLCALAQPHVAVLTNALPVHLEGFGNIEGVVRAKGEIIDGLPESGTVVLNADSPFYDLWRERSAGRSVLSFGMHSSADVYPQDVCSDDSTQQWVLHTPSGALPVSTVLQGRHNLYNALAAAAAALAAGADIQGVAAGLAEVRYIKGRGEMLHCADGTRVIDDTYNANPEAVKTAVDQLMQHDACERWLVLGSMGELGESAAGLHQQVGAYASSRGLTGLIAMGEYADDLVKGFGRGCAKICTSHEEAVEFLQQRVVENTAVLVKGSRLMQMEKVVQGLMGNEHGGDYAAVGE